MNAFFPFALSVSKGVWQGEQAFLPVPGRQKCPPRRVLCRGAVAAPNL